MISIAIQPMKNEWISVSSDQSKSAFAKKTTPGKRALRKTRISSDKFLEHIVEIQEEIDEGLGKSAEETISHITESHSFSRDQEAKITVLHSKTFEIRGLYTESLKVLEAFIAEKGSEEVELKTRIFLKNQLAICHINLNSTTKANDLVKDALHNSEEENFGDYFGHLYLTLARVNKKLGRLDDSFSNADKGLDYFRDVADWRGMASAYYQLGSVFLLKGLAKKSLDYFNFAIQIVGENSQPVILGRIFADMAMAHRLLNQPKRSVENLEKAIEFFFLTDNQFQLIFAYNNFGATLTLLGDWHRAKNAIKKSSEIAEKLNYVKTAGISDSLGELKFLQGDLDGAVSILEKGVEIARNQENISGLIQSLHTLARCRLAEEKFGKAIEVSNQALEISRETKEFGFINRLKLVLAEAFLKTGKLDECEDKLDAAQENDPELDFFVFGNIQRLRGLLALNNDDRRGAINYFHRALTIFEARDDVYYKALIHLLIGKVFSNSNVKKAVNHFVSASEIFRKLGVKKLYRSAEKSIQHLDKPKEKKGSAGGNSLKTRDSANSQLLMQRLAEAVVSRELLFRELVAVLRQESKVGRMIVAESDEENDFRPFLTHGYTPVESNQLVHELSAAIMSDDLKRFAKTKNAKIYQLCPPNAPPAVLFIYPGYTAVLDNGGTIEPLLRIVQLGMDVCALREKEGDVQIEEDNNPFRAQSIMSGFIHSSPAMTALVEEVYKIRSSDVTVLITGESGTGKELVARAIHTTSFRKDKVFVPFNCTSVPKELAEGHLFGYKSGAFTGAANDSPGMIRTADGGTLLLDEIGDLPIDIQPKLLRFLQEGEIQPLGEKRPIKVDVRVIAATNMDLEKKVKRGLFREDLFYRINVIRLRVPPLRERRSEIKPIVKYYINHYCARFNKTDVTIKPQTIDLLMAAKWDGNVRQLCNEIQRIIARARDGEVITPNHISPELKRKPIQKTFDKNGNVTSIISKADSSGTFSVGMEGATIEDAVSELETQMILDSMRRNDGNITRVAKELGLTRRGLYMKINRYKIKRAV